MKMSSLAVRSCVFVSAFLLFGPLVGCKKVQDPSDKPVSFWADPKNGADSDPCTHATAQAIVKSGLPYPRVTIDETKGADGRAQRHVKTVDVWVGSTRFVLPGELVQDNGMYAKNHPMRFWKLSGTLPNFYPRGQPGPVVDGMGAMVDVTIRCSVEPTYVASWGKGYRSNNEGMEKVKAQYEKALTADPRYPGTVTVSVRNDIGMTEVLLDRQQEANNRRFWEASYWPLVGELVDRSGSVSGIRCTIRNDPSKRYGSVGWRCTSSLGLTPEATASIDIYVSQIQHMPAVYEQVKELFINSTQ
jgi:hypothetical protein